MNLGNNKPNNQTNKIDDFIEHINHGFAKLLGKKNNNKRPQKTSNLMFSIIIILAALILWIGTGFYYLAEDEYGLILLNGRLVKVEKGLKFGFVLPYPFGDVDILEDTANQIFSIGASAANQKDFVVLDKNLLPFSVAAKFSYQITDPGTLYKNYLHGQDDFNSEVSWNVQTNIRNIIAKSDFSDLKTANYTVISNQILDQLNSQLESYGISLTKFDIVSINSYPIESSVVIANNKNSDVVNQSQSLAQKVEDEANYYYTTTLAEAKFQSNHFDELLSNYQKNPQITIEQMYNDTLNKIPMNKNNNYSLIFLTLDQLKEFESVSISSGDIEANSNSVRQFSRDVDRNASWSD